MISISRALIWYIYCLCLVLFAKNFIFQDKLQKLSVYICIVLHAGPTETRNQKSRPLLGLFRPHKSNGGLRFGKRASIENFGFFQGKPDFLKFREIAIIWYPGLCFGNRTYSWTCVDELDLILRLNHWIYL